MKSSDMYERDEEYKSRVSLDEYKEKLLENKLTNPQRIDEKLIYREIEREKIRELEIQKTRERVVQQMVKTITSDVEPLKEIGTRVVGDILDRVKFLENRIVEIKNMIEERKVINSQMAKEIDDDVKDRERFIGAVGDLEKIREFKMDATLLKMEKRKESANFWRDVTQLKKELMELEEQYQMEAKIAKLFAELQAK